MLAQALTGGITKQEILERPWNRRASRSTPWAGSFVLAPLPNLLYQRDTSSWIYGGVSVNAMAMPARSARPCNDEAIYRGTRCSPGGFEVWYHGQDAAPATIEGGDILVIGNGAVLADERADHPAGRGDARAPAVLRRGRPAAWWPSTCRKRGRSCTWTP